MARVSKESATMGGEIGPVTDRFEEVDGYTISFTAFHDDIDATPLMKGLPDDRCQCPHWGYVIRGALTFRYADREEVVTAGDAFYTPPGHVPVGCEPGSEIVMFSPAEQLRETEAAMARSVPALEAG